MPYHHVTTMRIILFLSLVFPVFSVDPTKQACSVKLPVGDAQSEILVNNLKFKEPKQDGNQGNAVTFKCETGFLAEELKEKTQTFVCSGGKYNGTYEIKDLLCNNDFHKSIKVQKIQWSELKSDIFECPNSGWAVYEVSRETAAGDKPLYRVCMDTNVMRPKFVYRLPSPEKIEIKHQTRDDVWGFQSYGKTTDERMNLSKGYVKKNQQHRTTHAFSDKYNQGKKYPYYFNRGHLVAFTDFSDPEDSKATDLYINAAPQWDILNKHSWSLVEREVRTMMKNNPAKWEIYTGTYGRIQSPRGDLFLVLKHDKNGKFVKGQLPVPLVFWKIARNVEDKSQSRAFVGVNNPEIRKIEDIGPLYRMCTPKGGIKGDENLGFTYECPVGEILNKLAGENIVLKNIKY